jgi:hypothetical protein
MKSCGHEDQHSPTRITYSRIRPTSKHSRSVSRRPKHLVAGCQGWPIPAAHKIGASDNGLACRGHSRTHRATRWCGVNETWEHRPTDVGDLVDLSNYGRRGSVEEDESLGTVGEVSGLISCDVVDAICRSVEAVYYRPYHETRIVFTFRIIEPTELKDQRVQMFCRKDDRWKHIPESSALFKATCVTLNRRLHRGEKIRKAMFLKHLFRCRLRTAGTGPAAYTVVDRLIERLA